MRKFSKKKINRKIQSTKVCWNFPNLDFLVCKIKKAGISKATSVVRYPIYTHSLNFTASYLTCSFFTNKLYKISDNFCG